MADLAKTSYLFFYRTIFYEISACWIPCSCAIILCYPLAWYERIHPMTWFFGSLGEKVSGVLIFFPPPDRTAALINQRASSLDLLSMHVLLLPVTGRIFFPFLFRHGEAHRSSHLGTGIWPGWLIGWVGNPSRVIIPVSVKHFFLTDWVSGS